MRKKKVWPFILLTIILCTGIFAFIYNKSMQGKDEMIEKIKQDTLLRKGYAFARDLKANTMVTQEDIIPVSVFNTSIASGMYMTSDQLLNADNMTDNGVQSWPDKDGVKHPYVFHYVVSTDSSNKVTTTYEKVLMDDAIVGRLLKFDVSKNTLVTDTVLFSREDESELSERMHEFNYILLPSDLYKDEYIDIRVRFNNGEDYLVLSGKKVEKCTGNTTIFLRLTEAELLQITSASIEAFMEDAQIYAIKYVDSSMQLFDETIENYVEKYNEGKKAAIEDGRAREARRILATKSGDSYEVTSFNGEAYVTVNAFNSLDETQREEAIKAVSPNDKRVLEYVTDAKVAEKAGMKEREARDIREALEVVDGKNGDLKSGDAKLTQAQAKLNSYASYHVTTKTPLEPTYAVSVDMRRMIEQNPNITDTIAKFYLDRENENPRTSKLESLQLELEQVKNDPSMAYGTNGQTRDAETIQEEINELLAKAKAANDTSATEQNSRRVEYLANLIKNSKVSSSEE